MVRLAVAKHGRGQDLDILVHDEDSAVLKTVIHAGRGKDLIYILLNEYDDEVVLYAAFTLRNRFGKYTDAYMQLFDANC